MTDVNVALNNFNAGELSPKVYGRFDLAAYFNGLRRMENFIGQTQGGAIFRGGTQFVAETKSGNKAFLMRFQFSDIQSYALEFTDLNIRIYKDRGIVLDTGVPIDVVTPYLEAELFKLKFAQNAQDLYIVHPNHQPRKLTRTSDIAWTLSLHAPVGITPAFGANDFPSAVGIYEQRLIYGGSINNSETLWFSKSADFDDFTVGTGATDGLQYTVAVGENANNIEWIKGTEDFLTIAGIGDILRATGGGGENTAIAPDQISIKPTNTFGVADINPIARRQSLFYMQRNNRTLLSFEKDELGIYKPVDNNIASDHITQSGITQIAYMEGRPDIVWAIRSDGDMVGMTINRRQQVSGWHRHTTNGKFISVTTTPRATDFDTMWVCTERTVNGSLTHHIEFLNDNVDFPRREDFVTSPDNKTIDDETFQRALSEAQKLYIHVDNAGTFDGAQRATDAGATLTIGAVTGSGITFIASAAIFTASDVGNEIWVKSTDGLRFGRGEIVTFTSNVSVDVDITVDFDATTVYPEWYITASVITDLDHLEGQTVRVVVDGAVHPDRTVSGGQITLAEEASVVHVGEGFTGTLETMDLEGGGTIGTAQTKKKSVYQVGLRLLDTLGLDIGTDYYRLTSRVLRESVDLMDNPPPLFTGDEVIKFDDNGIEEPGWSRSKRIIAQQNLPLPATVQLLTPYFSVSN